MDIIQFEDKNGNPIFEGCTVTLTTSEKVGEQPVKITARQRGTFAVYKDITVAYSVRYGIFKSLHHGEICTWYLETKESVGYDTAFYAGVGSTPNERKANASRPVENNLSRVLSKGLAVKCEIVENK